MPNPLFPRSIEPSGTTAFEVPTGLLVVSQSGIRQTRSTTQVGRAWWEKYPVMKAGEPATEAFLAWIEWAWNTQQTFDIRHYGTPGSGKAPNGLGSSGVTVSGGSQTGDSLLTAGWPASTSQVARAGDVIRVDGLNLLYRVREDAASDASGLATLKINPSIFSGGSPAGGAAVTTTGCYVQAQLAEKPAVPAAATNEYYIGLRLAFAEKP